MKDISYTPKKNLEILRKHKIYAKISKYSFEATQTEYLGFTPIYVNPHKTEAIENGLPHETKKMYNPF